MTETELTRKIFNYFKEISIEHPIHWVKVHGSAFSSTGQPDIDVCYYGQTVKLEVKLPGKRPTEIQEFRLKQWQDAGAVVGVVHSVEEVQALLYKAWKRYFTKVRTVDMLEL